MIKSHVLKMFVRLRYGLEEYKIHNFSQEEDSI